MTNSSSSEYVNRCNNPPVLSSLSGGEPAMNQNEAADVQPAQTENVKKTNKSFVREMEFITMPEFENIPP